MMELQWRRGLTIDIDPDSKIIYTVDMSDWFGAEADITSYELIPDSPLEITYHAREEMLVSFKVSHAVEGERRGITLRVTVDGPAEQQDDRTIFFRGRQQ